MRFLIHFGFQEACTHLVLEKPFDVAEEKGVGDAFQPNSGRESFAAPADVQLPRARTNLGSIYTTCFF